LVWGFLEGWHWGGGGFKAMAAGRTGPAQQYRGVPRSPEAHQSKSSRLALLLGQPVQLAHPGKGGGCVFVCCERIATALALRSLLQRLRLCWGGGRREGEDSDGRFRMWKATGNASKQRDGPSSRPAGVVGCGAGAWRLLLLLLPEPRPLPPLLPLADISAAMLLVLGGGAFKIASRWEDSSSNTACEIRS